MIKKDTQDLFLNRKNRLPADYTTSPFLFKKVYLCRCTQRLEGS